MVAWLNRATVTSTIDMLDAPALQIQRCTTKLSWVTYFIGVALDFSLSVLLLFLTDCVWPGLTQSQLPLHLLWLGIELWLGACGNSKCFPLLRRLRLGLRRLRLFLVCRGLPLRMFHKSIKHRFPCVVLAIAVTLWPVVTMVYAEADVKTMKRCYTRLKAAVYCCWCAIVTCLRPSDASHICQ